MKKYFILLSLILYSHVALPALRVGGYATGIGLGLIATQTEKISTKILCSGLYFLIAAGMSYHDYRKWERFSETAPRRIENAYNGLCEIVRNPFYPGEEDQLDADQQAAWRYARINTSLKNFKATLMRNTPREIEENWQSWASVDLNKNLHEDWMNNFIIQHEEHGSITFRDPDNNNLLYDPLTEKNTALALLDEPTQKHRNKFALTLGVSAIPLGLAAYTLIKNQIKK